MSPHASDDELIQALNDAAERRQAASALYRRYGGRFHQYLRRRGLSAADAEDAVQEAFIRILRGAAGFRPQAQGRAWIWQVARSAWLDLHKRQLPQTQSLDGHEDRSVAADVADTVSYQDCVHGQLARFAQAYPEAGQAVIWAAVDGFSTARIGELLGRNAGATRQFLSQARKRLASYLESCL